MERKSRTTRIKNSPIGGIDCSIGDPVKITEDPKVRKKGRRIASGKEEATEA